MGVIPLRPKTARLDEMARGPGVDKKGSLEHSLAEGQRRARGQRTGGRLQRVESGQPREESMSPRRRRKRRRGHLSRVAGDLGRMTVAIGLIPSLLQR